MTPRRVRVPAGKRGVAVADRKQAMGDGVAAARVTLLATAAAHPSRRTPDRRQDAPEQNDRDCE
jgi:hypothetical protein